LDGRPRGAADDRTLDLPRQGCGAEPFARCRLCALRHDLPLPAPRATRHPRASLGRRRGGVLNRPVPPRLRRSPLARLLSQVGSRLGWAQGAPGVPSTGFGSWVRKAKRPVRIGAILLPVVIFLLWDTPSLSLVIALVCLSLFLLLVIEFFGRAPPQPASQVPT